MDNTIKPIAFIYTDYKEKFGVPRQSGLAPTAVGKIIFEEEYRNPDYIRGIEDFTYIWLIFGFSLHIGKEHGPTVRPPKLGGQTHVGVFATRSPYRPNNLGLSSVRIERVEYDAVLGPTIYVLGADIVNKTPIYDIKPYIPYSDCHIDASAGFTSITQKTVEVIFPEELLSILPESKRQAAIDMLRQDPRPAYVMDESRTYGIWFDEYNILFSGTIDTLEVCGVEQKSSKIN